MPHSSTSQAHFKLYSAELSLIFDDFRGRDEARKLYHAATNVPMHDLDGVWREYEKFETGALLRFLLISGPFLACF